jgi:hypothetical protein
MPEFSPLAGHVWLLSHWVRQDRDLARDPPWKELVPQRINLNEAWNGLRLDWWAHDWLLPPRPKVAQGIVILSLLFLGVAVPGLLLARRLRRAPEPEDSLPPAGWKS